MSAPAPPSAPLHAPLSRPALYLLLTAWGLLVCASLAFSAARIQRQAEALMQEGARNVFRTIVAARAWNSASGGVYVPVSEENPPNPWLNTPHRELRTHEGVLLTQINPAYMTRLIAREAARSSELQVHMTGLRVIRPENSADAWERRTLERFELGEQEVGELVTRSDGLRSFRYMAPLRMEERCLACHAHMGFKVGDIRGGISISQPWREDATRSQLLHSALLHGLVFLLLTGGSLLARARLQQRWAQTAQAMDSLMQTEKMASLGRLVAGFAHELNTPLGVAISAQSHAEHCLAELNGLLDSEEVSEQALRAQLADLHESTQLAQANLRRATMLVAGFKRSSTDIEREDIRSFKLRELVEEVLQTLRNVYKHHASVELICPDDLSMTSVPGLLDQIFTNLIVNSVTHGFRPDQHDGQIRIVLDTDGAGYLLISYADDGAGMPPEVLPRIFEPFFTTREGQGGSGLGLFICFSLITQRLGGSIRCDSQPGAGTHFHIRLPLHTPTASPASEMP